MKPTFRDVQHLRRALRGAIRDLRVLMGDLQEAFDELPAERADFSDASVVELSDACEHAVSLLDDLRGCDAFEDGDIHGTALATLDAISKYFDELRDDASVDASEGFTHDEIEVVRHGVGSAAEVMRAVFVRCERREGE